jgi:hypothetical protein
VEPFDFITLGNHHITFIVDRMITLVLDGFFAIPVVHIFFAVKFGLLNEGLVNFIGILVSRASALNQLRRNFYHLLCFYLELLFRVYMPDFELFGAQAWIRLE